MGGRSLCPEILGYNSSPAWPSPCTVGSSSPGVVGSNQDNAGSSPVAVVSSPGTVDQAQVQRSQAQVYCLVSLGTLGSSQWSSPRYCGVRPRSCRVQPRFFFRASLCILQDPAWELQGTVQVFQPRYCWVQQSCCYVQLKVGGIKVQWKYTGGSSVGTMGSGLVFVISHPRIQQGPD
jgi:hypothetical protein